MTFYPIPTVPLAFLLLSMESPQDSSRSRFGIGQKGCTTRDVGYIESIIVRSDHRRRGIAEALAAAAEAWARDRGAEEMASDVDIHNDASLAWHTRAGFEEVGRSVLFKKDL